MIELAGVSKTFTGDGGARADVHAVRDVSLTVADGEIFGIIGFSGAGKSTLVRLINLLERPTAGKVFVSGVEMTALPEKGLRERRRKIGMIFQHFNLMRSRTVLNNVMFPLRGSGLSQAEQKARVAELLRIVGLSDKAGAYPEELSGGQKQRVAIARALANEPDVLLCDEATSALDPQTTQDILALLRRLNAEMGLTIVLITHEMAVVKEVCTRVAVMEDGRVVETGDVYTIFSAPQQEITRRFIRTTSNLPRMEAMVHESPEALGLKAGDVVARFSFQGEATGQALVSQLSREFGIDISILFGNVEVLRGMPLGTLVVALRGDAARVARALAALAEMNVQSEVISRA